MSARKYEVIGQGYNYMLFRLVGKQLQSWINTTLANKLVPRA